MGTLEGTFLLQEHNLTIRMPNEIDHHQAKYISEMADMYIMNGQVVNVIFDFSNTAFMDSSGIGIVVGRYKKVSLVGGKVFVIHANRRMEKMLYMSGLMDIVEMIEV